MSALPGVARAKLNFGAAKLTVEGDFSLEAVAAEARKEQIEVRPEGAAAPAPSRRLSRETVLVLISGVLLAAGWLAALGAPAWLPVSFFGLTVAVGGYPTARKGIRSLLKRKFDTNVLMTVAVVGAGLIGQWSEAAVVAFLFNISEALESYAMDRARGAIRALMDLAPKVARVRRGHQVFEVPVADVQMGDTMLVRPGEKIALDGVVCKGASAINQAAITGESVPVEKEPGQEVYAGTLNGEGALEVTVTKRVADTTLARIVHMVEEAQAQRAPAQKFVDGFARYYTPAVMILAALVMVVPPLLFGQPWGHWLYEGLALLVVSCPCALVVSTPVALVSGIANAARNGVLIKGGLHLEQAGRVQAIAFDKTGTLTHGRPAVTDVVPLADLPAAEVLRLAGSLEQQSEHPLARAVLAACREQALELSGAEDFRAITGKGARALIGQTRYVVGNPRLFAELGIDLQRAAAAVARLQAEGKTAVLLGTETEVLGVLAVADTLRAVTPAVMQELRRVGVRATVMLTGDNLRTAQAVAGAAGITAVQAELLPQDKVAAIRTLQAEYGRVAMIGDGVNDAPALATADLGIAMGGAGSDVALETADIALMGDDLAQLPFLIRLSRATLGVIQQNIGLALVLKLLAMVAIFPGWLTLWLAIVADMGATILVTLNGVRLLRIRPR